jgi:hypothetical protein
VYQNGAVDLGELPDIELLSGQMLRRKDELANAEVELFGEEGARSRREKKAKQLEKTRKKEARRTDLGGKKNIEFDIDHIGKRDNLKRRKSNRPSIPLNIARMVP